MKRLGFFSAMMAILLVSGLEFAACQNSNDLIGTWTGNEFLVGETIFTFASDNTVVMNISSIDVTTRGTYVVSGNNITLRFALGDVLYAQRNGNNLIIEGVVYTKSGGSASNNSPRVASPEIDSLIGTWTGNDLLAGETTFTFAADNTVAMNIVALDINTRGTYVVVGNNITLRFGLSDTLIAQRNGNNLIIDGAVYTKGAATSPSASTSSSAGTSASQQGNTAFVMASEQDFKVSLARDGTAVIDGFGTSGGEVYSGNGGNIIIPARIQGVQVTSIRGSVFYQQSKLTGVQLPEGLKEITGSEYSNFGTFSYSGVRTIIIPNTVTRIGDYGFAHCRYLESITIPDSVTVFGSHMFQGSGLKNFIFPAGLIASKIIPESMFSGTALSGSLIIPEGIEVIGVNAFFGCEDLTSVTLPSTIKKIDDSFRACSSLTEVIIPASVTRIDIDPASFGGTKLSLASQARIREVSYNGQPSGSQYEVAVGQNNLGNEYYDKGDYDSAIDSYTMAIMIDPNYAIAYNNRGNAYINKGDYDRAIADLNQAIRLDPNYAIAYNNRGYVYNQIGDYDRAIADYTQVIRLDPNLATAYNNRAAAYNTKGDYDRAITDATEAIRLSPNQANPYAHRANAYFQKGNYTQARTDVNRSLQINPNQERAKNLDAELRQRGY